MSQLLERKEIARVLAEAHRKSDPSINRIIELVSQQDSGSREPVKLLEVNPETSPSGIIPIAFSAFPPKIPFPSVVIEITEEEFESVRAGDLKLPEDWVLGETLYSSAA